MNGKGKWAKRAETTFDQEAMLMRDKLEVGSQDTSNSDIVNSESTPVDQNQNLSAEINSKPLEVIAVPESKKAKPIDDRNVYVSFSEETGKASFQGKFRTEHRTNKAYKLIGQVGVPKNVYTKVSALITEEELSIVELVNLLLVDVAEKGAVSKDLLKRYRNQKNLPQ